MPQGISKSKILSLHFGHLITDILKTVSCSVTCQLELNISSMRAFYKCKPWRDGSPPPAWNAPTYGGFVSCWCTCYFYFFCENSNCELYVELLISFSKWKFKLTIIFISWCTLPMSALTWRYIITRHSLSLTSVINHTIIASNKLKYDSTELHNTTI